MTMAVGSRKPEVDVGVPAVTPAGKKGAAGGGPLALVGKFALTKLAWPPAPTVTGGETFEEPLT